MNERLFVLRKHQTLIELGIAVGLFTLAMVIRLPYLVQVPAYTDESVEVLWGLDIALGKHFPLTAVDAYDGPLFAYLIAILFRIFGASIELPRLMVAVFGAGTVIAVYALARVMRDRMTGLVAASLALTSPILITLQSHQAWSSSLTPFFATVTAAALYVGVTQERKFWLAASGFFAAMTLQTHPTSAAVLVGMLAWFFWRPDIRTKFSDPFSYLALFFFLIGYAPMLIAHARSENLFLDAASQQTYAFAPTLDVGEYFRRLGTLLRFGGYVMGGGIGEASLFLRAQAIVIEALFLLAFGWAWWRRERLIPLIVLGVVLLLPLVVVSDSYRYYFSLIPLAHVLLGLYLVVFFRSLSVRLTNLGFRRASQSAAFLTYSFFVIFPLITIADYYRDALAREMTNAGYYELAQKVSAQGACGSRLFVEDWWLTEHNRFDDLTSGFAMTDIHYVLTLNHCAHDSMPRSEVAKKIKEDGMGWLIITPQSIPFFDSFRLELVANATVPVFAKFTSVNLYRIESMR